MNPLIGTIILWPVAWVPEGWLLCDGSRLLIADNNAALFSLLGSTYGGDGLTYFNLPDLRGMVAVGAGISHLTGSYYTLADCNGQEVITLTASQLPSHAHTLSNNVTVNIKASNAQAQSSAPTNTYNSLAAPYDSNNQSPIWGYNNSTPNVTLNTGSGATISGNTGITGSGQPYSNLQPYLVLNYIIAIAGTYPSKP